MCPFVRRICGRVCTKRPVSVVHGDRYCILIGYRFGDAVGGLIVAELAWLTKWLILFGALLSMVGAGLQSLQGMCDHMIQLT